MRIGCDLDEVLYDFEGSSRFLLKQHFGVEVPKPSLHWEYTKEWLHAQGYDGTDHGTDDPNDGVDAWEWLWTHGVEAGLFRHGHMMHGAVAAVNRMAKAGQLVILTKRPRTAIPDTLMWLGFHAIPAEAVHILGPLASKSFVHPHCDVYIDDSLDNVVDLLENTNAKVLLWDAPWNLYPTERQHAVLNQHHFRYQRVTKWDEVHAAIEQGEEW